MPVPAEQESLNRLEELLTIWSGDGAETVPIPILDQHWSRGAAVYAQAEHASNLAKSVLLLYRQGMRIQAVPLLRLIQECGVTAAWLATTEGSGDAALAEAQRQHALLRRALARTAAQPDDPELDPLLDEAKKAATEEGKHFEARCRALDEGRWLYANYRLLSQYSHAGAGLLDAYLDEGEPDPRFGHGYRLIDPQTFPMRDAVLSIGVVFLHMAVLAWDHVSDLHERSAALAGLAHDAGIQTKF